MSNNTYNNIYNEIKSYKDEIDHGVDELAYYLEVGIKSINYAKSIFNKGFGDESRVYKETHGEIVDYATESDRLIEFEIKKILATTNLDILGEEFGGENSTKGYCWIIDPIDGTLNYGNRLPFAAISLALAYNGNPIIGIISTPKLNDNLYFGIESIGSWKNYNKINVIQRDLKEVVIAYDGVRGDMEDIYINKIKKEFGRVRLLGTTATELALCAEGGFGAVFSPMAEFWDVAGGVAIIKGAGGIVCNIDGSEAIPGSGSIVAGCRDNVYKIIDVVNK
jgi:myo-inositol-1(or 4)-monophosphatase